MVAGHASSSVSSMVSLGRGGVWQEADLVKELESSMYAPLLQLIVDQVVPADGDIDVFAGLPRNPSSEVEVVLA